MGKLVDHPAVPLELVNIAKPVDGGVGYPAVPLEPEDPEEPPPPVPDICLAEVPSPTVRTKEVLFKND